MRLDRLLSQCTGLSRKAVRPVLRNGRVRVNGRPETRPASPVREDDRVTLDDEPLTLPAHRYIMLHKPAGVVCARRDPAQPCVTDLLPATDRAGLQIVGRLDKDTTGLLLLTDDGDWNHRLTAPRRHCPKVYEVTTAEPIDGDTALAFERGLTLRGDKRPTRPARLEQIDSHRARVTIREGRYHQVRRMFAATGNRVTALHRIAIGRLTLDPTLPAGACRTLTDEEIALAESR